MYIHTRATVDCVHDAKEYIIIMYTKERTLLLYVRVIHLDGEISYICSIMCRYNNNTWYMRILKPMRYTYRLGE